jgi:cytochrome P450
MKDTWGDDADEFKPERFSNGAMNACKHPYGLYCLGSGARNCIGQQFAVIGDKIVIALILKHFRFRLSPNYRHAPYMLEPIC